jgi:hypothetical protein
VFDSLDFIYMPSRDAAADLEHYAERLGAEPVFAIERFGTRVAMLRLSPDGPSLLLAEHLEGERPILIFRVADLEAAIAELEGGGRSWEPPSRCRTATGSSCSARVRSAWRSTS